MRPNLVIPLASSYDQRFVVGATATNVEYDQRKVNCWYEVVENPVSGKLTLMLAKRPGVATHETFDDYGTETQVPYLLQRLNATGAFPLLIVKDGDDTKVIYPTGDGTSASATVLSDADYAPAYAWTTNISGTNYIVLQLRGQDEDGSTDNGLQRVYYSSFGTLGTWTEIADTDFANINKWGKMCVLDGTHYVQGNSGIYGSDLNSISSWESTNFIGRATEQDFPMGLIPYGDRILSFGENTCETYYNAGNKAGSLLSRVSGRVDRVGLSASFMHQGNSRTEYYCYVGNRLFFLGKDSESSGQLSLMTYNGSVFERVSGLAEDRLMAGGNAYGVFQVTVHGQSAVGILLTAPGAETARGLLFFPEHKSWFEWESEVFTLINSGTFFAGVASPDVLYTFGAGWDDAGTNYTFLTQFRLPIDDDEWHTMHRCGVQADTVSGATLAVKFNDTGGKDFTGSRTIDLSKGRKDIYRCGMFRERYVQLSNTSDDPVRLRNFYANVA